MNIDSLVFGNKNDVAEFPGFWEIWWISKNVICSGHTVVLNTDTTEEYESV